VNRPSSIGWIAPLLLGLQLALLWIQGAQLHRQNQVLQGLREDVQNLAEVMESNQGSAMVPEDDARAVPLRSRITPRSRTQRVAHVLGVQEEQDPVAKELQASKASAEKAVKDARETQKKLSWEENSRKAEEAKKLQAATDTWQRWVWGAVVLLCVAFGIRAYLRRR
jgi:hypothetical protein